MATLYQTIQTIQTICLSLPETQKVISHSVPTYKAAEKIFSTFPVNHHCDEKVALLLNISADTQTMLTQSSPIIFFVPPYTGPKCWVGIELNKGLAWNRVAELTLDTYRRVASAALAKQARAIKISSLPDIMSPEQINPLRTKRNLDLLSKLSGICLALPETTRQSQFGSPCFQAGKKPFAPCIYATKNHSYNYG